MGRPGTSAEAFFRHNALRGEYGPGDIEDLVRERMDLAREFQAHHIQRERPNGTTLDIRGVPLPGGGWIAIYSDVTEQRRSELALLQSHTDLEKKILERTGELGDQNSRQNCRAPR